MALPKRRTCLRKVKAGTITTPAGFYSGVLLSQGNGVLPDRLVDGPGRQRPLYLILSHNADMYSFHPGCLDPDHERQGYGTMVNGVALAWTAGLMSVMAHGS